MIQIRVRGKDRWLVVGCCTDDTIDSCWLSHDEAEVEAAMGKCGGGGRPAEPHHDRHPYAEFPPFRLTIRRYNIQRRGGFCATVQYHVSTPKRCLVRSSRFCVVLDDQSLDPEARFRPLEGFKEIPCVYLPDSHLDLSSYNEFPTNICRLTCCDHSHTAANLSSSN